MVTDTPAIDIREIKELSELKAVEDLQKEIWGCTDREILPSLAIIPLLEIGGVLLGAFDSDQLIGFVLGFPGNEDGRPIVHSDMLAVKRAYRSRGVGYRLKLAQRESALAKGIDKITWTFDPLQSLNAHLNFAKLGVIADKYKVNYYGETSSPLHRTGTDRLWVTWQLESESVKDRLERGLNQQESLSLGDVRRLLRVGENNAPVCLDYPGTERLVIEIPGEMDSLLETDLPLARRWRETTRTAFTVAIEASFVVEEFFRAKREKLGLYFLNRRS